MDAFDGHGFALIDAGDLEGAAAHVRAGAGALSGARAFVAGDRRRPSAAAPIEGRGAAASRALAAIAELRANSRTAEAAIAAAFADVHAGRPAEAFATLERLLAEAPPGFAGWTLPVEPFLAPLRSEPAFQDLLRRWPIAPDRSAFIVFFRALCTTPASLPTYPGASEVWR